MPDILYGLITVFQGTNIMVGGGLLTAITLLVIISLNVSKKLEDKMIVGLIGLGSMMYVNAITGFKSVLVILTIMLTFVIIVMVMTRDE